MNVNKLDRNINFTGYKNLISHGVSRGDNKLLYMAMTLYDDEQNKDLTTFHEIKQKLVPDVKEEDVIALTFAKYGENNEAIFLDTSYVPSDNDLKNFEKKMSKEVFDYYEKTNMKIYTFLGNLTRRIMNDEKFKMNSRGFESVLRKFTKVVFILGRGDNQLAHDFIESTLFSQVKPQSVAKVFHKNIKKRMIRYFA